MMDAMASAGSTQQPTDNASSSSGGAMPNPWSTNSTSTPASTSFNPTFNPSTNTNTNTNMNMNMPMDRMIQMMDNPLFQNLMDQMLQDPSALQAMTESNPYLQQMR